MESFPSIKGNHELFLAFEEDLGVETALKIAVESFEINQCLLFSNVYEISL